MVAAETDGSDGSDDSGAKDDVARVPARGEMAAVMRSAISTERDDAVVAELEAADSTDDNGTASPDAAMLVGDGDGAPAMRYTNAGDAVAEIRPLGR